jgi:type VI protein secretion system component VasF
MRYSLSMSITLSAERDDEHAARWQQWKARNASSDRRSAIQARIVFALVLTASAAWLGLQLLSSPAWS